MSALRTLRLSRSLNFLDLAHLSGIPARALAEAEYGLRPLSWRDQERLAFVLGVCASDIAPTYAQSAAAPESPLSGAPALIAVALAATLATAALQGELPHLPSPQSVPPARLSIAATTAQITNALSTLTPSAAKDAAIAVYRANLEAVTRHAAAPREQIAPALLLTPPPAEPAPRFRLSAAGPTGCPVQPVGGHVVITQGYGVGSHAPASIWGAVDLAVDSDGDGYAEPAATWYTPVAATHAGSVRVDLNTYPAGNHVWVEDEASGWRTGYSHLAVVTVISGQRVQAGDVIGMIGSTGASSGPHLDYQVWHGEQNVDPTALIGC